MGSKNKKNRGISLDCLGVIALLQLQQQGVDVSKQLRAKGKQELICFTPTEPISAPESKPEKTNKYGVAEVPDRTLDGIVFDSKKEMLVYRFLQSKHVKFDCQPEYVLQEAFRDEVTGRWHRAVKYVGDFLVHGPDQKYLVDVKGHRTQLFRMKEKLLLKVCGVRIYCLSGLDDLFKFLLNKKIIG